MARILGFLATLVISVSTSAATLEGITNTDAVSGLKQALTDGSAAAVAQFGAQNGFFMIAGQEKNFRQNPLGAASDTVKRVFGALR